MPLSQSDFKKKIKTCWLNVAYARSNFGRVERIAMTIRRYLAKQQLAEVKLNELRKKASVHQGEQLGKRALSVCNGQRIPNEEQLVWTQESPNMDTWIPNNCLPDYRTVLDD